MLTAFTFLFQPQRSLSCKKVFQIEMKLSCQAFLCNKPKHGPKGFLPLLFPASSPTELQEDDSGTGFEVETKRLSGFDRLGIRIETTLTDFFTCWGTACARHPLPVMAIGVALALGLASGIT